MTIYIYSNETAEQVAHYVGSDNTECEKWADEHWGSNDYHWSYVDVPRSNAVPFEPTHVITLENGEPIEVMLVDGAAYTREEWDATDQADYERQDNGDWTFQGEPFAGTVKAVQRQLPVRILARWDKEDWDDDRMVATQYRYYDVESGEEIELTEEEASRYSWGQTEDDITGGSQAGKLSE